MRIPVCTILNSCNFFYNLEWKWQAWKLLKNALSNSKLHKCFYWNQIWLFFPFAVFPEHFSKYVENFFNSCLSFPNGWLGVANVAPKKIHITIASQKYGSMKKWIGLYRDERLFEVKILWSVGDFFSFWIVDEGSAAYL